MWCSRKLYSVQLHGQCVRARLKPLQEGGRVGRIGGNDSHTAAVHSPSADGRVLCAAGAGVSIDPTALGALPRHDDTVPVLGIRRAQEARQMLLKRKHQVGSSDVGHRLSKWVVHPRQPHALGRVSRARASVSRNRGR